MSKSVWKVVWTVVWKVVLITVVVAFGCLVVERCLDWFEMCLKCLNMVWKVIWKTVFLWRTGFYDALGGKYVLSGEEPV